MLGCHSARFSEATSCLPAQPLPAWPHCRHLQITGHSWNGADGLQEESELGFVDARLRIYLPAYTAAITNSVEAQQALQQLAAAARRGPVRRAEGGTALWAGIQHGTLCRAVAGSTTSRQSRGRQ